MGDFSEYSYKEYVCPSCEGFLKWSHNGSLGTTTRVICSNNIAASRVDFTFENIRICFWEGICERLESDKIIIKNKNGSELVKKSFVCKISKKRLI